MEQLTCFGAPAQTMRRAKPHIGTDKLRGVVKNIRREIERLGGEIKFGVQVEDLLVCQGKLAGLIADGQPIACDQLVLAVGHSARDTFEMLMKHQIPMIAKAFSVGLRIEHLQSVIDRGLYGKFAGHPALEKGEYQLSHREGERGVYTFCMCPGGVVVPSASEWDTVVTNGTVSYTHLDNLSTIKKSRLGSGRLYGSGSHQRKRLIYLHGWNMNRLDPMFRRFLCEKRGYAWQLF